MKQETRENPWFLVLTTLYFMNLNLMKIFTRYRDVRRQGKDIRLLQAEAHRTDDLQ